MGITADNFKSCMESNIFLGRRERSLAMLGCTCRGGLILSMDETAEYGRPGAIASVVSATTGKRVYIGNTTCTEENTYMVWSPTHQVFLCVDITSANTITGFSANYLKSFSIAGEEDAVALCNFMDAADGNCYEGDTIELMITSYDENRVMLRGKYFDAEISFVFSRNGSLVPIADRDVLKMMADAVVLEAIKNLDAVVCRPLSKDVRDIACELFPKLIEDLSGSMREV